MTPAVPAQSSEIAFRGRVCHFSEADLSEKWHILPAGFRIANPNTTISYEVYLLAPDWKSPEDGVLVASGEKTHELAGFYMEYLPSMGDRPSWMAMQKGQSYSVVMTQKTADGSYAVNAPVATGGMPRWLNTAS